VATYFEVYNFGKLDELRPTDEKTEIYHTNTRYDSKLLF
jgi:hypothetical protein